MKFWKWVGEKFDQYLEVGARFKNTRASRYFFMSMIIPLTIIFFVLVFIFSRWNANVLWVKNKMSPNKILVEQTGIRPNDNITIKWTCEYYCDTLTIYAQHMVCNKNFKISGGNIFLVYLNDSLISRERQFKAASWQGYKYHFIITKVKDKFRTKLQIEK